MFNKQLVILFSTQANNLTYDDKLRKFFLSLYKFESST